MLQPNDQSKSLIVANVEIIQDEHGRYNLNVLHKASPAANDSSKAPNKWLTRKSAQELIKELISQTSEMALEVTRGGDRPGTYAVEPLAVAYAAWISPSFHLLVIQAFIDVKTGRYEPTLPAVHNPATQIAIETLIRLDAMEQQQIQQSKQIAQLQASQQYLTIREYVMFHQLTHQLPPGTAQQAYGRYLVGFCKEMACPLRKIQTEAYPEWQYPVHIIHQTLPGWLARRNGQLPINMQIHPDGVSFDDPDDGARFV